MEQCDPGGTSYAPAATPPKDGARVRWKQQVETMHDFDFFNTTPLVANGLVYGVGQELVCVDSESGETVFRADDSFAGPPALADVRAYRSPTLAFGTGTGAVGLNAHGGLSVGGVRIGLARWQAGRTEGSGGLFDFEPSGTVPVAAKGTVFVTTGSGLLAIDASSGRVRWRAKRGVRRPAVHSGTVYIARGYSGGVLGYDIETGERTFSIPLSASPTSVTATTDRLIVRTTHGLVGIDYDETRRWRYTPDNRGWERGGVAVADGVAYTGFDDEKGDMLVAIDTTDGTELWRSEAAPEQSNGRYASPSVANGVVYVPTEGNELVAVDTTDGHVRWRFTLTDDFIGWSPIALAGESLYALGNGHLYALEEQ